MPSASQRSQDWAMTKFGSLDEGPIMKWLENHGWSEDNGLLTMPNASVSEDEMKAAEFLCEEWDFALRTKE